MLTLKERMEKALTGDGEDVETLVQEITGVELTGDYPPEVKVKDELKLTEEEELLFGKLCAQVIRNYRADWPRVDWNCVGCY